MLGIQTSRDAGKFTHLLGKGEGEGGAIYTSRDSGYLHIHKRAAKGNVHIHRFGTFTQSEVWGIYTIRGLDIYTLGVWDVTLPWLEHFLIQGLRIQLLGHTHIQTCWAFTSRDVGRLHIQGLGIYISTGSGHLHIDGL